MKTSDELIGYVGVDSGTLLISDPEYIIKRSITIPSPPPVESTQIAFQSGAARGKPAAVFVSTEIGDGVFPVYMLRDKQGEPIGFFVSFGDDDGDEEDEENEPE